MIEREKVEDARIQYLATLISFLAEAFFPNKLDDALNNTKSHLQEEIILNLCKILKEKDDRFYELYNSLKVVANGNECIVGIKPISVLKKEDLAAWIATEMDELFVPLHILQDTPGFNF